MILTGTSMRWDISYNWSLDDRVAEVSYLIIYFYYWISVSVDNFTWLLKGKSSKNRIFYAQANRKLWPPVPPTLGKTSMEKNVFFWALPEWGGGGRGPTHARIFCPFSRSAFLVNKKSLFLQKCQCIELLTVFRLLIYLPPLHTSYLSFFYNGKIFGE